MSSALTRVRIGASRARSPNSPKRSEHDPGIELGPARPDPTQRNSAVTRAFPETRITAASVAVIASIRDLRGRPVMVDLLCDVLNAGSVHHQDRTVNEETARPTTKPTTSSRPPPR